MPTFPARIPLPRNAPVPAPRPVGVPPDAKPAPTLQSTGEGLTLDALMARQKEAALRQGQTMQEPVTNIPQGLGQLGWTLVNALQERRAEKDLAQGNADVAKAFGQMDWNTGQLPPEAMQTLMQRDPETGIEMYKTAMALRASQGKQDVYGPPITGQAASALGLDPSKSYQLNATTGQYDQVGGGGTSVTVGTGEKMSEALVKDTTYYPGALNANLELDDLDQALTSPEDAGKSLLPGSNFWTSPAYQQAQVAGDAWIMNILRRESGASIGKDELAQNRVTYLPQPGDDAETVLYKRRLREERTATLRYGLEAAAPETLAKIDKAYENQKLTRAERKKKKAEAAAAANQPDPNNPDPNQPDTGAPAATAATIMPDGSTLDLPVLPNGEIDYDAIKKNPALLSAVNKASQR